MNTIRSCPCCESTDLLDFPAVLAPFLAHYAVGGPPTRCSLLECRRCSFRFFDSRLTEDETRRLYADYRGERYYRARNRDEFWYTRHFNQRIGHDLRTIARRKALVHMLLRQHIDVDSIRSVLDYGGDAGQFIPDSLGKEKFVFDISNLPSSAAGVHRISSEAELYTHNFDLVMLCHVLEHCSDPVAMLTTLKRLGNDAPRYCYIEVPYERYSLALAGRGRLHRRYLDMLLRMLPLLTVVDFCTSVLRLRCNLIPPLGVMKCHEHLNFFNEKSLGAILRSSGFQLLACTTMEVKSYMSSGLVLYALCRSS